MADETTPKLEKYLVTVDAATRRVVRVQELGASGELSDKTRWRITTTPAEGSDPESVTLTVDLEAGSEDDEELYRKYAGKIPYDHHHDD